MKHLHRLCLCGHILNGVEDNHVIARTVAGVNVDVDEVFVLTSEA